MANLGGVANNIKKAVVSNPFSGGGASASAGAQSATPQVQQGFDMNAYLQQQQSAINNVFNQQRDAQLAQFRAQRDKAVGDINQQKAKVAPQYQGMRNQTDVVNMQNAQRLREMMAANGLGASGENVTATVSQNNARQNSLNSLNLQEQEIMNDFEHRISQLNDPSEENALIASIEAQRARALMEGGWRADEIGYSRGRDSIMDSRYLDELNYNRNWDTKKWDYQVGRDQVADNQWQSQFDRNIFESDRGYNYQLGRDKVSDQQWQQTFDENKRQFGEQMALQKLEYELDKKVKEGQLSIEQARLRLAQAKGSGGGGGGGGSKQTTQSQSAEQVLKQAMEAIQYDNYKKMRESSLSLPGVEQPGSYWYMRGYGNQYNPVR